MKKLFLQPLILIAFFIINIQQSFAVTAYPHPLEYKLPDGTTITIQLMGDEKVNWAETLDGFSILINNEGYYEYAVQNDEGDLILSGVRAFNANERNSTERAFLSGVAKGLRYSKSQTSLLKQIWMIKEKEASKAFPTTGDRQLICILMGFADLAFTKTQGDFNLLFNQVGYIVGGATGSVKDYYLENSYSQFNLTVDVAGPYTASYNMAYYGGSSGTDNPRPLIAEAINLADDDVNYANYDNDGDGWVDGVYVIYAGYGREAGGPVGSIWAHAWQLASPVLKDGVYLQRYSCSAELRGNSGSTITAIGVICHEFGHVLGAPDFYDTDYDTGGQYQGTGQWDMMASGSWNNNGVTPAHHNGFTKVYYYEWATATVLSSGTTVTLNNASQHSNSFYRYNTTTTNEYFLLENREKHLFDNYIPGSGMIIYHVHSGVNNVGNSINATHPQRMYPVAQNATMDPTSTPSSYGTINAATCAWTGTGKTSFTDATLPSSKSWAGANTSKPITNISRNATAKTVTFDFMGGAQGNPTEFTTTTVSSTQINLSWVKSEGRDVLLAFNTTSTIGTPSDGVNYSAGQSIPGGGTVIYAGGNQTFQHTGLNPSTTYYYKIWTKLNATPEWSPGVTDNATTSCDAIASLPFTEDFNASTSLPDCWQIIDHQGNGQVWQFGTHASGLSGTTGNYAYLNSDAYGSGNSQNTDLVTPPFNLSNYTDVTLSFKHYFLQWSGSSGTLSYSINGGSTWTQIQQWTTTSANPATFNQVIAAVAGQANVKFKWNYTGTWGYYWDIDDVQITGTLTGDTYALTLLADPSDIGAVVTGAGNYTEGANVNISASTVSGYTFTGWTGASQDVALLANASAASTSFSMPARAVTFTANYQDQSGVTHLVTFNVKNQDEVPIEGAMITVLPGSKKSVEAPLILSNRRESINGKAEGSDYRLTTTLVDQPTPFIPDNGKEGEWIHWDDGTNYTGIGYNGPGEFAVASRWEATDLTDYDGLYITQISFFPREENATYALKIWVGDNHTSVLTQDVEEVTIGEWNIVELETPYLIDASDEMMFGYYIITQAGWPAGADAGPAVGGKGDMLYDVDDGWVAMAADYGLNYNWNIQAYVVALNVEPIILYTNSSGQASFDASPGSYTYTVEKDGYSSAYGDFDVVDQNLTINVTLVSESTPTYLLTLQANPGDIGAVVTGAGNYAEGANVNISASTVSGYTFTGWTGASQDVALLANASAASTSFSMPARTVTLTANYEEQSGETFTVTFNVDMTGVEGFNPAEHNVYLVGTITDPVWIQPGTEGSIEMELVYGSKEAPFTWEESWEDFADFTTNITPWVTHLINDDVTWGATDFDFPGEGDAFAFMVFNPAETEPDISGNHPAYAGSKYLIAVQSQTVNDNKWLISPATSINETSEFSFAAKSITAAYGLERFRVLVSTTGTATDDFTQISAGDYLEAPTDWTPYSFDLSDYAGEVVHIAIQYVSYDAFIFMLDDFKVTAEVEPPAELIYTATVMLEAGTYQYKYFSDAFGAGWAGGEWDGDPNRVIIVEDDTVQDDIWGVYEGVAYLVTLLPNPSGIGAVLTGGGLYEESSTVNITASTVSGYAFTGWTGSAEDVALLANASAASTSFSMPARAVTLTANYQPIDYTVTLLVSPAGAGTATGSGTFNIGDIVTVEAFANAGFEFLNWRIGGSVVSSNNPYIFSMPAENITITAHFKDEDQQTYTLTLLADPDDIGAVLVGSGEYLEGDNVSITAGSVTGYDFTGWTGDPDDLALLENTMAATTSFVMPNRDIAFTATYQEQVPTYLVTLLAYPNDIGAVLTGGGLYEESSTVNITASTVSGYAFTGWTGSAEDVALLANATAASTSFSMPARTVILTANYEEQTVETYTVTFIVRNPTNSTIVGASISIAGYSNLTTDASGIASIQLPNGNYSFTITASGYGVYSDVFTVADANRNILVVMNPVDVGTEAFLNLEIYPNPFGSSVTLKNADKVRRVIFTNIIGQNIKEVHLSGSDQITIPTDEIERGIYLIVLETEKGVKIIRKLVKQ